MSTTTISPAVKRASVPPGDGGKSTRMSKLPCGPALNALTPVENDGVEPGVPTMAKLSCVGSRVGSKLKYQLAMLSASTRPIADMASRTVFGPPNESSKVAVMKGGSPAGVVPPLYSTSRPNVMLVAPALLAEPSAEARTNPASQIRLPLPKCEWDPARPCSRNSARPKNRIRMTNPICCFASASSRETPVRTRVPRDSAAARHRGRIFPALLEDPPDPTGACTAFRTGKRSIRGASRPQQGDVVAGSLDAPRRRRSGRGGPARTRGSVRRQLACPRACGSCRRGGGPAGDGGDAQAEGQGERRQEQALRARDPGEERVER